MGWDEWMDNGKGKGGKRRGGREKEKEKGCIWMMESKSADSCG